MSYLQDSHTCPYYNFLALSISRLPGGPGIRSTIKPADCILRLTSPLAQ